MEFQDKVVVVTGGAKGIGRCIWKMFQKEGKLLDENTMGNYVLGIPKRKIYKYQRLY